jgi:hypothetical protein
MDVVSVQASYKAPLSDFTVSSTQTPHYTLCGIMDISTALFAHGLFTVTPAHQSDAHNAEHLFRRVGGDTYVRDRRFRAVRVLNHLSRVDSKGLMPTYAHLAVATNA